ncbi:hypothetical protein DFH06DRAFT_1121146 [Mycena polygramma]|nr:hypothetical protein DFH06DRAFT_1121146 [Mycena polygramma]
MASGCTISSDGVVNIESCSGRSCSGRRTNGPSELLKEYSVNERVSFISKKKDPIWKKERLGKRETRELPMGEEVVGARGEQKRDWGISGRRRRIGETRRVTANRKRGKRHALTVHARKEEERRKVTCQLQRKNAVWKEEGVREGGSSQGRWERNNRGGRDGDSTDLGETRCASARNGRRRFCGELQVSGVQSEGRIWWGTATRQPRVVRGGRRGEIGARWRHGRDERSQQ